LTMRAALLGLLFCAGCVDIKGGAIDLAWTIFGPNGQACCPDGNFCKVAARMATVRVNLFLGACRSGAPDQQRSFPCPSVQGASQFDIPPGTYCIQVCAVDETGNQVANGPGPILRDVIEGDVVELGAVALTVATCPSPFP